MRTKNEVNTAVRRVNIVLGELGAKYWGQLPILAIIEALRESGFDTSNLDGVYCGRDGRVHESVGEGKWIFLRWIETGDRGRLEVLSYVS